MKARVPTRPEPPARLSTTTCWPSAPASFSATTRAFIKSPPDGYTLFLGHTGSISINPSLYANAGFDPRKDFAPIGLIASMPVALLAHPSFPAKTIGDTVAIAKTAGAKFNKRRR